MNAHGSTTELLGEKVCLLYGPDKLLLLLYFREKNSQREGKKNITKRASSYCYERTF